MEIQPVQNNTDLFLKNVYSGPSFLGIFVATIAYFNFEWRYVTLVMFNDLNVFGLRAFLAHYDRSVIVKFSRYVPRTRINIPQFVIFGQSTTDIITTLKWLYVSNYNTGGKYIIACIHSDLHACDERQIFQTLSKLYMLNVVLLKKGSNNNPLVYSYRIFKPGNCINGEPELLDWVPDCKNSKCFQSIFYEKLSNFHKCQLYISTLEQPPFMYLNENASNPSGADGEVIKLVADIMNATLVMRTPANGTDLGHYDNDNWSGCLGDAFNSRAHASMCLAPLTSHKYGNFQISFTYYSVDIVWTTKLPELKPSWEKIVNPLKSEIRYILLFMFVSIIILNALMKSNIYKKMGTALNITPCKHNLLFYSWIIFLGMPVPRLPDMSIFRTLIYTWVWFCFIIRSGYQGALVSSLKHDIYEAKFNTWQDVIRLPYGGMSSFREYYLNNPQVYANWEIVNYSFTFETLDKILDGDDFVLAVNKDIIKHHVLKYNGSKYLQIIREKIVSSPVVIYFKKYSPLAEPMSQVLRTVYEGGFIQHIYEKYLLSDSQIKLKLEKFKADKLKMEHYVGCFLALAGGYFLSFIYFLVEVICGKPTVLNIVN